MFRKPIVHLVIGALILLFISAPTITAQPKAEITPAYTASVKKRIVKLGTGAEAKVQVKLQDKTKLKGYVSKITEDSFVVTDSKTNAETTVSYPTVTDLKMKMSTGEVITVSALAAGAGLVLLMVLALRYAD
jgi:hypothetical protein